MSFLKIGDQAAVRIDKVYFTVGTGRGYDISSGNEGDALAFTLHKQEGAIWIIPGNEKIKINGGTVSSPTRLEICDRITWRKSAAVFLDESTASNGGNSSSSALKCLEILQRLASELENEHSLQAALQQALAALVEMAGAESGYLLSEIDAQSSEWKLLASVGVGNGSDFAGSQPQRELVSNTVVNEAIRQRRAVCLESIVGHPWAANASILGSKIFSVACLPLTVAERVFGCVYLSTRSPGRSLRKEGLDALSLLATQSALLLASRAQLNEKERENAELKKRLPPASGVLVYNRLRPEHPMQEVDDRIARLAGTDLNILILGETGTGKELVAHEIAMRSPRARGPFVAINCGAIPPSLIESTLFGHAKGAFTGASQAQVGKFVQADGGTLFLDEIGDLPLELQVKLLRVLQERKVEPIGSNRAVPVDFRVVAATHQDLGAAVAEGRFRQDLFYRLAGATIDLPALRERGDDVVLLAEHFLRQSQSRVLLSSEAQATLRQHRWPGNVRELQQVILRAAALAEGGEITAEDLELGSLMKRAPESPLVSYEKAASLKEAQVAFTQDFVRRVLQQCDGVRSRAASNLGISERTLYRILSPDSGDSLV